MERADYQRFGQSGAKAPHSKVGILKAATFFDNFQTSSDGGQTFRAADQVEQD